MHRLCLRSERIGYLGKKFTFGMYFTVIKKTFDRSPGSGAAGLKVVSGQVKMKKNLFKELEIN